MANTAIPNTAWVSGSNADVAGTAIVAANTHTITPSKALDKTLIRLVNTTASTKVFTVTAGDNPPAQSAGQGDLTVSLTDGSTTPQVAYLSGLESARFLQNDGTVVITVAAATTGFITAFAIA